MVESVQVFTEKELVDKFVEVSRELENMTYERDAYRAKIIELAEAKKSKEKSVDMAGENSAVKVSFSEKLSLDVAAETFKDLVELVTTGDLPGVIKKKVKAVIVEDSIDQVKEILEKAGLENAMTVESSWVLDKKNYGKVKKLKFASKEGKEAQEKLDSCIKTEITPKVVII